MAMGALMHPNCVVVQDLSAGARARARATDDGRRATGASSFPAGQRVVVPSTWFHITENNKGFGVTQCQRVHGNEEETAGSKSGEVGRAATEQPNKRKREGEKTRGDQAREQRHLLLFDRACNERSTARAPAALKGRERESTLLLGKGETGWMGSRQSADLGRSSRPAATAAAAAVSLRCCWAFVYHADSHPFRAVSMCALPLLASPAGVWLSCLGCTL